MLILFSLTLSDYLMFVALKSCFFLPLCFIAYYIFGFKNMETTIAFDHLFCFVCMRDPILSYFHLMYRTISNKSDPEISRMGFCLKF